MIANISFDFSAIDEYSITIFIVGYVIVFTALIILSFLFQFLPKIINFEKLEQLGTSNHNQKPKDKKQKKDDKFTEILSDDKEDADYAAIAMAIHLHLNDMHDEESLVLTINRQRVINSPWSSKIYNS
jgi:glutaconyl-CoA/methylmalonyl-CoA decarboxylase subunit delta